MPAIIEIKKAAAIANRRAGELDPAISAAIQSAATEQLRGIARADYPVDIYHGGGGTAANMNVNEVLANLASEILAGRRGPYPDTRKAAFQKVIGSLAFWFLTFQIQQDLTAKTKPRSNGLPRF